MFGIMAGLFVLAALVLSMIILLMGSGKRSFEPEIKEPGGVRPAGDAASAGAKTVVHQKPVDRLLAPIISDPDEAAKTLRTMMNGNGGGDIARKKAALK